MIKILLHITKEVLEKSKYCGINKLNSITKSCAVAVASQELFPNCIATYGVICDQDYNTLAKLPFESVNFMIDFDSKTPEERVKMEPISFEVEVPDNVIEQIGISEVHEILSKSETMELITV